jgi:ABC transporter DrrB family efflux protein
MNDADTIADKAERRASGRAWDPARPALSRSLASVAGRWRPVLQLFLARVREFCREPVAIFWVYGFPLFLVVGLGLAFSGDDAETPAFTSPVRAVIAVQDGFSNAETAALQSRLEAAGLSVLRGSAEECQRALAAGKAGLVIVPQGNSYEYVFDPHRPESLIARYKVDALIQRWQAGTAAVATSEHRVSQPGERYIDFLIPGLMGLNLMGGGLWGVGYTIVDMRVRKLLKRLLATPMRRSDFLLAIVGPRLVFLLPEMLVLTLVGHWGFGMPIRGDVLTLALVAVFGAASFAAMGLLAAARTANTEVITGVNNLLMLPMWMLSGTFFSSSRFPEALQPLIRALPLTQANDALRAVILDGASLPMVVGPIAILTVWAVVCFLLALVLFRWS